MANCSIHQWIKANLYSAICRRRIRGAYWRTLGLYRRSVYVHCTQCQTVLTSKFAWKYWEVQQIYSCMTVSSRLEGALTQNAFADNVSDIQCGGSSETHCQTTFVTPTPSLLFATNSTRSVLSQGNRAKPYKFQYVKSVGNFNVTKDIAIEEESSHFRRPHSHLTPPHRRTPMNIGTSLISPETTDRGLHLCPWQYMYMRISVCFKTIMPQNQSIHVKQFHSEFGISRKIAIRGHRFRCRWKAIGGLYSDIIILVLYVKFREKKYSDSREAKMTIFVDTALIWCPISSEPPWISA